MVGFDEMVGWRDDVGAIVGFGELVGSNVLIMVGEKVGKELVGTSVSYSVMGTFVCTRK